MDNLKQPDTQWRYALNVDDIGYTVAAFLRNIYQPN